MKKLKKAVLAVLSAVLVVGNINAVFADGDISVRMNGIVSNDVSYINFTDTKPIQIDNRTLTLAVQFRLLQAHCAPMLTVENIYIFLN